MTDLDALLAQRPALSLDELAEAANERLPELLLDPPVDSRVKPEVNPRLIRHYVGEGLLDAPLRDGKRSVYTVDHLLQLLALRRLLSDGLSASGIGESLRGRDREELRAIAEGRAGVPSPEPTTAPSSDDPHAVRAKARAALDAIRSRSAGAASPIALHRLPSSPRRPATASVPSRTAEPESWERLPLIDGVELHVRSDVVLPDALEARQRLLDYVVREIVRFAQGRNR